MYLSNIQVSASELDGGVGRAEVPVHLGLAVVSIPFQRCDLAAHRLDVGDASLQALTAQRNQLHSCNVESAAMLGRAVDFQALGQRQLRLVSRIQRLDPVRVQGSP